MNWYFFVDLDQNREFFLPTELLLSSRTKLVGVIACNLNAELRKNRDPVYFCSNSTKSNFSLSGAWISCAGILLPNADNPRPTWVPLMAGTTSVKLDLVNYVKLRKGEWVMVQITEEWSMSDFSNNKLCWNNFFSNKTWTNNKEWKHISRNRFPPLALHDVFPLGKRVWVKQKFNKLANIQQNTRKQISKKKIQQNTRKLEITI